MEYENSEDPPDSSNKQWHTEDSSSKKKQIDLTDQMAPSASMLEDLVPLRFERV